MNRALPTNTSGSPPARLGISRPRRSGGTSMSCSITTVSGRNHQGYRRGDWMPAPALQDAWYSREPTASSPCGGRGDSSGVAVGGSRVGEKLHFQVRG